MTIELEDHTVVNDQGIEHPPTRKCYYDNSSQWPKSRCWSFFFVHLKCSEIGAIEDLKACKRQRLVLTTKPLSCCTFTFKMPNCSYRNMMWYRCLYCNYQTKPLSIKIQMDLPLPFTITDYITSRIKITLKYLSNIFHQATVSLGKI